MDVKTLIARLEKMPPHAEVALLWDGGLRGVADRVWYARSGQVGIGPNHEVIYTTEDRPRYAPDTRADNFWSTDNVNT